MSLSLSVILPPSILLKLNFHCSYYRISFRSPSLEPSPRPLSLCMSVSFSVSHFLPFDFHCLYYRISFRSPSLEPSSSSDRQWTVQPEHRTFSKPDHTPPDAPARREKKAKRPRDNIPDRGEMHAIKRYLPFRLTSYPAVSMYGIRPDINFSIWPCTQACFQN